MDWEGYSTVEAKELGAGCETDISSLVDTDDFSLQANKLNTADRTRIVAALVEGNSIRATCRMTGAAKGTTTKLLADFGKACAAYHDAHVRNVACKRVQCDEIWSFVGAKMKNVPENKAEEWGMCGLGRQSTPIPS